MSNEMIITDRLILRKYLNNDLEDYYSLCSSDLVWKYSTKEAIINKEDAKNLLEAVIAATKDSFIGFHALIDKEDGTYIGEAGVLFLNTAANRAVIGYNLLPDYWSKGYATEITISLVKFAFDSLGVERVEALAVQDNIASCHVLEKAGLKREGVLKHFARCHDNYFDVCYYGLITSER